MKKLFKFVGLIGVVGASALLYQNYMDKEHQKIVSLALNNARLHIEEQEEIIGSWIDTTVQFDDALNEYVFTGEITTKNNQYNFVSSAHTGQILLIEKII